jgi:formate hydrogenlyase subunit 3/multisubunit Na+/H+ antiporter MnhD subunit
LTLDEIAFLSFLFFLVIFVGIKSFWWSIWSNARHRSRSWSLTATKSRVLVAFCVVFFCFVDCFFSDLSFFNFANSSLVNNFDLSKWL